MQRPISEAAGQIVQGRLQIVEAEGEARCQQAHRARPLAAAMMRLAVKRPKKFGQAISLTVAMMRRSDRAAALHAITLAEACLLVEYLEKSGVTHIHAHFGTNSAEVAMLASCLSDIPYSFTVHGPDEFDAPRFMKLGEKVARARFVAAISHFCASQIFRWAAFEMGKVAHRALEAAKLGSEDLDVFVPHQANTRINDLLAKNLHLREGTPVANDIEYTGNTSAASIPLAMEEMLATGKAKGGQTALLLGFGAGLSYAGAVVTLPPAPKVSSFDDLG